VATKQLKTRSPKMARVRHGIPGSTPKIDKSHAVKIKASTPAIKPPRTIAALLTDLKSVKTPYGVVVAKLASGWVAKYPEAVIGGVRPPLVLGYGSSWSAQDLKDAIGLFNA